MVVDSRKENRKMQIYDTIFFMVMVVGKLTNIMAVA
jgi:hypothetical protein